MRGVDHYLEAETHLQYALNARADGDGHEAERTSLCYAQVHATLALAGATAMQAYSTSDSDELADWEDAAGGET